MTMAYVIIRITDGHYVARPGLAGSYTRYLQNAKVYPDKMSAERDLCPQNESVIER